MPASQPLKIYNTLSRSIEEFKPLTPGYVSMYVCGPTVYSYLHLGNCRTFMSFDIIFRYLRYLGFKVRYVRNITDAGHLEGDRDEGRDKFAERARIEKVEPMEIVQKYTLYFHDIMRELNCLPPSIEPTATGHIIEQIEMTKDLLEKGWAYITDGTVFFDVEKYNKENNYGILSNRKIEDLLDGTRELGGQDEKKGRLDFALWIKAKPEHIMQWPSPWGMGFPGWHIECSAMSQKYLGEQFDIHGGGMDLIATHHTNEIAQSCAAHHKQPVRYWMHTNMLTVNGVRMSKSAGNGFLPDELFAGNHPLLERGYSPMTVRFFMMQSHYRSTLDFSNDALQAAEKGYKRLMAAINLVDSLKTGTQPNPYIAALKTKCETAMNDDFNTPVVLAHLFDGVTFINNVNDGREHLSEEDKGALKKIFHDYVFDVMGLKEEKASGNELTGDLINLVLEQRAEAKARKDFATSDALRKKLLDLGIEIKDGKEGTTFSVS
jgi:cysteinyl-tRNA synthetase